MKMNNEQKEAGLASDLNRELDTVDDGMMCVWRDNTEISHYLMMHINDQENMEGWQESLCADAASVIDRLRAEVRKLRSTIKQEADYCYKWAAGAEMMGDDDRAKRHKERGDRLMASI